MKEFLDKLVEAAGGTEVSFPPGEIAARLLAAMIVGWILGWTYRRTHTGQRFSPTIPHTQMLLALGGALIWLVVGDSLVRAFGLAGTIGLIRYRTRIRDPKDTTVLLFSMILGMACGLGHYAVAGIGLLFVILALYWLAASHRYHQRRLAAEPESLKRLLDVDESADDGKSEEQR